MKRSTLILPLLLLSGLLFGQPQTNYTENDLRELANFGAGSPSVRTIDLAYEGVRGTAFLSEDWQKGAFLLKGREAFSQDMDIQIDLVKQLMYFRLNNGFMGTIPSGRLDALRLNVRDDKFRIFRVYPEVEVEGSNAQQLKFYEELYAGDFTLLKHHYKIFREADYKRAYSSGRSYDEYQDESNLWLRKAGQDFHKVKLKKNAIIKALPDYAEQIKKVLKAEQLSLQREEDLIRLLQALPDKVEPTK